MTSVIIPTYNAEPQIGRLLSLLKSQTHTCDIMVVDSSSADRTAAIAKREGARVMVRDKEAFDHGGTRSLAAQESSAEFLVYLTQDALPADEYAIENILRPFSDEAVAAAYGRQLPAPDATAFAAHLRNFNYPAESYTRSRSDASRYGIKTPFLSNSFSCYRRKALQEIGFFKERLIASEDTYAGAKLLLAGYRIAYAADAAVFHSHNYSLTQEFRRYFDIGVGHRREGWILEAFGRAEGEGMRYLKSEIYFLRQAGKARLIPEALLRNALKYSGYALGRNYELLPAGMLRRLSMNSGWWERADR